MANYRTPGVYIEEISTLPPSVAEVATAVPAFIGYTEVGPMVTTEPVVKRIASMLEFMTAFGGASPARFTVTEPADQLGVLTVQGPDNKHQFSLYYALTHYFKNGGGPCYVVSVGDYSAVPAKTQFTKGLETLEKEDEPTLIVLTDAGCLLSTTDYYALCGEALVQCKKLGDRFTVLDVVAKDENENNEDKTNWEIFRDDSSLSNNLMYGAAYTPYLQTSLNYVYSEDYVMISRSEDDLITPVIWTGVFGKDGLSNNSLLVSYSGSSSTPLVKIVTSGVSITFVEDSGKLTIRGAGSNTATEITKAWSDLDDASKVEGFDLQVNGDGSGDVDHTDSNFVALKKPDVVGIGTDSGDMITMASLVKDLTGAPVATPNTGLYNQLKTALAEQRVVLPPSAAMAGIYARVDREQGVWKAPANTGVMAVLGPVSKITDDEQDRLNVDPTAGKSINAIRAFTGKGTLVWGARTLAGNDNEWRYVSVRRLFITIEESTKKASAFAVFEANDQSTWLKVKAMIESYLYGLWEQGALAGAKPEDAYYVNVGLGTTMTPADVLGGRMIVEIGIAAVRPAEFIILKFSHKLQTA